MAIRANDLFIEQLRRVVLSGHDSALPDGVLLGRFVERRDHVAFEVIVRRHGPMVFGVCNSVLRHQQDAEDAYQATFLVLARKAARVVPRDMLGNWLYGVARRIALGARSANGKRSRREQQVPLVPDTATMTVERHDDMWLLLDREVSRLPNKYRAAVVLCDLEGKTRLEAARQLGWPEGSVSGRLARGRALLAKRLAKHGPTFAVGALAEFSRNAASASVPPSVIAKTIKAATLFAAGQALTGIVSQEVIALTGGVLQAMLWTKLKTIALAALFLGMLAFGGGGLLTLPMGVAQVDPARAPAIVDEPQFANKTVDNDQSINEIQETSAKQDAFGDALPPHALARLGTVRLRHGFNVLTLGFSADGKNLLSTNHQNVRIWDAATGQLVRQFGDPGYFSQFAQVVPSADIRTIAFSLNDGDVEIWDALAGVMLRKLKVKGTSARQVALSPDAKTLAVYDGGKAKECLPRFSLFDVATGEERHQLIQDSVDRFVFSKDSTVLLVSNGLTKLHLWDVATGQKLRQIDILTPVQRFALSPDMRYLATPEFPGEFAPKRIVPKRIVFWDLDTGKEVARTAEHALAANLETFGPDGTTFLSSDATMELRWWDVATGRELPERNLPARYTGAVALSPNGRTLAVQRRLARLELWDLAKRQPMHPSSGLQASVNAVASSADGRFFATGDSDGMIRIWDSVSGQALQSFPLNSLGFRPLQFLPDSSKIVAACNERPAIILGLDNSVHTVRVLDLLTGKTLHSFPGSNFAISPDGKFAATIGKDRMVHFWDLNTGQERAQWQGDEIAERTMMTFSPDSRSIIYYTAKRLVCVKEAATGKTVREFEGPDSRAAFSPDGRLAAFNVSGGDVPQIVIYDTATGDKVRTLMGNSKTAVSKTNARESFENLTFSASNGLLAATGYRDGAVHVWEIATGQEFQQFVGHRERIYDLAFSPDGARLLSAGDDATGLIWDVNGRHATKKPTPLSEESLNAIWSDLGCNDAVRAQRAVGILAARPEQALPLCHKHLRPIPMIDAKRIERLFARLDDDSFQERTAADRELEELGYSAEQTLRRALERSPSLEARRRIEKLLARFDGDPERLRNLRILQILEQCGSHECRAIMNSLADGAPGAWLTREAQAAMERLAKRSNNIR